MFVLKAVSNLLGLVFDRILYTEISVEPKTCCSWGLDLDGFKLLMILSLLFLTLLYLDDYVDVSCKQLFFLRSPTSSSYSPTSPSYSPSSPTYSPSR